MFILLLGRTLSLLKLFVFFFCVVQILLFIFCLVLSILDILKSPTIIIGLFLPSFPSVFASYIWRFVIMSINMCNYVIFLLY